MLTRKDYKAIAGIIRNDYQVSTESVKFCLRDMIDRLSQYFATDDPRFDRQKFLDACGLGD